MKIHHNISGTLALLVCNYLGSTSVPHAERIYLVYSTLFICPLRLFEMFLSVEICPAMRIDFNAKYYSRPGLVIWAIARCTLIGRYVGLMWCSSGGGRLRFLSMVASRGRATW
jgi:hypothetical protein